MRFKVANYSRLEIRLDTLHIYSQKAIFGHIFHFGHKLSLKCVTGPCEIYQKLVPVLGLIAKRIYLLNYLYI